MWLTAKQDNMGTKMSNLIATIEHEISQGFLFPDSVVLALNSFKIAEQEALDELMKLQSVKKNVAKRDDLN
jgi:hypothetical protein